MVKYNGACISSNGSGTPSGTPAWTIEYGNPGKWTLTNTNTRYTDFSVDAAGVMHAAYGQLKGMSILAADGSVLMRSGGASAGAGGNLLDCGDFVAEVETSGGNALGGKGWTTNGTATFSAANATVTINAGSYIDQISFFPITSGENLYIQVEGTGLTTANCVVTIMGHTSAKAYIPYASTSASGGNWDVDASGTALFAKETLANSGNANQAPYFTAAAQFGQIRISTPSGQTPPVISSVWVGRAPKTISGNYAATYIRDAAVDTLQIKGNAVTIQTASEQQNNVTLSSGGTWTQVLTNTFNTEGGGYVALFAGALEITDDNMYFI